MINKTMEKILIIILFEFKLELKTMIFCFSGHGHHVGPTIITVNGVSAAINGAHNLDSMLYSMDEPRTNPNEPQNGQNVLFDEAIDLEPIDFEHFIDEPDLDSNSERVFKVSFGSSPPGRGR